MNPMNRDWQFEQLSKGLHTFHSVLQLASPQDLTTYRDNGTGWTALEVLCHLRDFEQVFLERAQVTMEQEFGDLPFPNPDQLAAAGNYNQQDMDTVYSAWVKNREDYLAYLKTRSEDDWKRLAKHPKRGPLTLDDQLLLVSWHDVNHLEQLTRILREKKG